ncbi:MULTISPECIES: lipoyl(octanoyl) transferase LipB [unclassified Moraxella]|uniref:lipoyl(octanoyl) transferase LipB n=1 Tax=unclassified Moraxella TaxID=2685852 RepID=UPI00359E05B2
MTSLKLNDFSPPEVPEFLIKTLSNTEYTDIHTAMLERTLVKIDAKKQSTPICDELWLVEHDDVYTLGQAGKKEHILYDNGTPIIHTDRGGQVTWHGTGQLTVYFLWDLHAIGFSVRDLVSHAEQAIEDIVNDYLPNALVARARRDAPGVYIYNSNGDMLGKIASLGFKIKHGHSYHGIAINLTNDLSAFNAINPCGYAGMTMVKLEQFGQFNSNQTHELILKFIHNLQKRHEGEIALRAI